LLFGAGFPTVKYLRVFSGRFGPSANRQQIIDAPEGTIRFAYLQDLVRSVAGPIPGACCSSSELAVFRFTGFADGFFFPASTDKAKIKPAKRKEEWSRIGNRRAMTAIYCSG
jgi:hypothetical protein